MEEYSTDTERPKEAETRDVEANEAEVAHRSSHNGPQNYLGKAWGDLQQAVRGVTVLSPAAEVASDAVLLSVKARESLEEQAERFRNVLINKGGVIAGEFYGEVYGGLFAKDPFWIFREPSRTQKFPVLLVRDAENGNLFARWRIGASMAFESELCARTLPRVLPAILPAFRAGFEIGMAVGRNRAVNFKMLWMDAFLGSLLKQLKAQIRITFQQMQGSAVRWDDLSAALKDAVTRGQSARRIMMMRIGLRPTKIDPNAPQVLRLLPSHWVPDIGLPLADGIGRGFFSKLKVGFKKGWRRSYIRPRFETWDVDDVPQPIIDLARQQGAEQAALVASSVGDTVARDFGWWCGGFVGAAWGFIMCAIGRKPPAGSEDGRVAVADGYLDGREELLALEQWENRE